MTHKTGPKISLRRLPQAPKKRRGKSPAVSQLTPTTLMLGRNIDLVDAVDDAIARGDVGRTDLRAVDAELVIGQLDRSGLAVDRPGRFPLADVGHELAATHDVGGEA